MPSRSSDSEIPHAVRRLLIDQVRGFEELELLLRLCRDPSRAWTLAEAQAALGMHEASVEAAFDELVAERLIAPDPADPRAFRFQPATDEQRAACVELMRLHDEDRFRIVALMGQLAFERIHHATARAFADAFRIRKPPKGGDDDA